MASVRSVLGKTFLPKLKATFSQFRKLHSVLELYNSKPLGCDTCIKGWVKEMRKSKTYVFFNVNDGSCNRSIQVVISRDMCPKGVTIGASVCSYGKLGRDLRGNVEISAESVEVIGKCDVTDGFPFTIGQKHSFDYCRQYLHHRPKLSFFSSLFRTRHSVTQAVHKYFNDNKFISVHTPILTSNDCEGAGETFTVVPSNEKVLQELTTNKEQKEEVFFNGAAYLTVSGQFHLEVIARCMPKVYTFNPTFRAENSKSRLHLSEFYMVEAEEAFIQNLTDILTTIEIFVKNLLSHILLHCESDANHLFEMNDVDSKNHMNLLKDIINQSFSVMSYSEAKDITKFAGDAIKHIKPYEEGLTKEEELFLVAHNKNIPIFIIDWPNNLKPFYAKACDGNSDKVQAVDLLVPVVGELCGGSVREDDFNILREKLEKLDMLKSLNWYLDLRKYGNVRTGGFGMGFERFLQFALNIQNIKDTLPFPRWPYNIQM